MSVTPSPPKWLPKYQWIPFTEFGDSQNGANCYGLIRLIYMGELRITLPRFAEISAQEMLKAAATLVFESTSTLWRPVALGSEQCFDVAIFNELCQIEGGRLRTLPCHAGLVTSPGWVVHTKREHGVVYQSFTDRSSVGRQRFVGRLNGIFRHKDLVK